MTPDPLPTRTDPAPAHDSTTGPSSVADAAVTLVTDRRMPGPAGVPADRYELCTEIARGRDGGRLPGDRPHPRPRGGGQGPARSSSRPGSAVGPAVRATRPGSPASSSTPASRPSTTVGTLPDGRPFLAMKLIKGRTLDDLLPSRPDPAADRGRFAGGVRAGLPGGRLRPRPRGHPPRPEAGERHGRGLRRGPGHGLGPGQGPGRAGAGDAERTADPGARRDGDPQPAGLGRVGDPGRERPRHPGVHAPRSRPAGEVDQVGPRGPTCSAWGPSCASSSPASRRTSAGTARAVRVAGRRGASWPTPRPAGRLRGATRSGWPCASGAWRPEPEDRPADAGAVAAEAAAAAGRGRGAGPAGGLDGPRAEAEARPRGRSGGGTAAAVAVLLGLVLVGAGAWAALRAEAAGPPGGRRPAGGRRLRPGRAAGAGQAAAVDPGRSPDADAAVRVWEQAAAAAPSRPKLAAPGDGRVAGRAGQIRGGPAKARRDATLPAGLKPPAGRTPGRSAGRLRPAGRGPGRTGAAFAAAGLPPPDDPAALAAAVRAERPGVRAALVAALDAWVIGVRRSRPGWPTPGKPPG